MPRYYCDYCDTYLTHDSPSVRKQHNAGYKHKANVRQYYQQFEEQQTQSLIDQRIKEHLGQAAYQVGAAYLAQRPRLPVLPTPVMPMPMPGGPQPPIQMMRPPVFPRPMPGTPGYGGMGGMMYPGPPGPPNGPPMGGPFMSSGSGPISPAGIPGFSPATYQSNAPGAGGNGFDPRDGPPSPQDGGGQFYSHPQEASH